jgi:hypothetical protein
VYPPNVPTLGFTIDSETATGVVLIDVENEETGMRIGKNGPGRNDM